jgi:CRP/FNR family transcriptional regulator
MSVSDRARLTRQNQSPPSSSQAIEPGIDSLFSGKPCYGIGADEGLFWEGDAVASVFQVVSGVIRTFRFTKDGRRGITAFILPGEILGLAFVEQCFYSAQAVVPSKVRRLSLASVRARIEGEDIRRDYLAAVGRELQSAQSHILVLSQLGAEERVAAALLDLARRMGIGEEGPVQLSIPMSRSDLADYLGLSVETVCRAITHLRRNGCIDLLGPRTIVISPWRLARAAGDDPSRFDERVQESDDSPQRERLPPSGRRVRSQSYDSSRMVEGSATLSGSVVFKV